ncbi:hypothetical protein LH464_22605 [Neorhizobium sp. T786]|uniref:hypothetical protein n=1 Tax=Pseudorhizobium xiangyangii TaxID=2883104 RepID=UPI001D000102|nr:hypothetical protein [Neorhizobium xiangyangii]MCB5205258.1 hypothetical protein [Neorhizobium xiangyangii]
MRNLLLVLAVYASAQGFRSEPVYAQDLGLEIGPNGVRPIIRDNDRDRDRDEGRTGCSPREARAAARDEGLRDPEVVRSTRRSVTVEGMTRRGPDEITFANERGCPEM